MSTAHRQPVDLAFAGGSAVTLEAAWAASDGSRVVWSLTVAFTTQGPRPLRAEGIVERHGQTKSLAVAAPDDIELTEDPGRCMLHAQVRANGEDALVATFQRAEQGWRLVYAGTALLAKLGFRAGRYELDR